MASLCAQVTAEFIEIPYSSPNSTFVFILDVMSFRAYHYQEIPLLFGILRSL
ncbi:hypothetical protein GQ43DRAFT_439538 [Delitschia confertaspora ATCC 74209]|uniref:Uncharacterized protein n=1 Tax=Delitschia confertaspora ATCC 74209 TaxID=1513339 RepID=A0A9P4JQQ1_9PLEO|nr:hypothetical protein GQ43DRAFT_439538 [Delitschia confertaspora ATCC 74209]